MDYKKLLAKAVAEGIPTKTDEYELTEDGIIYKEPASYLDPPKKKAKKKTAKKKQNGR